MEEKTNTEPDVTLDAGRPARRQRQMGVTGYWVIAGGDVGYVLLG